MRAGSGFTLIEVMVSMVLTAILVLGLSAVWTVASGQFLRLALRQKAILALSGETERLVSYYARGGSGLLQAGDTTCLQAAPVDPAIDINGNTVPALIYPLNGCAVDVTQILAQNVVAAPVEGLFDLGQVYVVAGAGAQAGVASDNLVWLDRDKHLAGRLFWTVQADGVAAQNGAQATPDLPGAGVCPDPGCRVLTTYLRYPVRVSAANGALSLVNDLPPDEWVSLQTIVGVRL
ncbi:MAG: prepilin-type N-terminal cleavage/methylation domain-containing protein [Alphaproteobacteria bacterium]